MALPSNLIDLLVEFDTELIRLERASGREQDFIDASKLELIP